MEAILRGIAPDGGLYVPEVIPKLDWKELRGLRYDGLAKRILGAYFTDYTADDLEEVVSAAYDTGFETEEPVVLRRIGERRALLELWHGPTLAFKDMALQVLPQLLRIARKKRGEQGEILILTATSGDTGKAAMEGFSGVEGFRVVVFYPLGGTSALQRRQMLTHREDNVRAFALRGDFDACQRGVKRLFGDEAFRDELEGKGIRLSSANSINIGRLVPQIVYYYYAYLEAVRRGMLAEGELMDVVVPTGNFGNILAARYAKEMGLPIGRLCLAANSNRVLFDFLSTGVYDRRRELVKTSSPSMDILVASNLERYLYLLFGGDAERVRELMRRLDEEGVYEVDPELLDVEAGWADETETAEAIREIYKEDGVLIDPHTAVAISADDARGAERFTVIASTASPFKFADKVLRSIGEDVPTEGALDVVAEAAGTELPLPIREMNRLKADEEIAVRAEEMEAAIRGWLGESA